MKEKIKIIIADDHKIFRKGIISALSVFDQLEIIGEAENGLQLLEKIEALKPDVVLVDVKMPEMDGFEFLSQYEVLAEELKKETQIFMLSSTLDPHDIQRAESNPYVKSLLNKPLPINEFREIIYPDFYSRTV